MALRVFLITRRRGLERGGDILFVGTQRGAAHGRDGLWGAVAVRADFARIVARRLAEEHRGELFVALAETPRIPRPVLDVLRKLAQPFPHARRFRSRPAVAPQPRHPRRVVPIDGARSARVIVKDAGLHGVALHKQEPHGCGATGESALHHELVFRRAHPIAGETKGVRLHAECGHFRIEKCGDDLPMHATGADEERVVFRTVRRQKIELRANLRRAHRWHRRREHGGDEREPGDECDDVQRFHS